MFNQYMPILNDMILPFLYESGYTILFTDGGHRQIGKETRTNHKGPSAWAYAITSKYFATPMYNSDGYFNIENNAMEVQGILEALKMAWHINARSKIVIVSDSMYALNTINGQVPLLRKNNFKNSTGTTIDWWQSLERIDNALHQFSDIKLIWTKGHDNNEGNILVDRLVNYRMDELSEKMKIEHTNKIKKDIITIDNVDNNLLPHNQSDLYLDINHIYINTLQLKKNIFTSSISDYFHSNNLEISGRIHDIPISFNPEMIILLYVLKKFLSLKIHYKSLIVLTENKKLYDDLFNNSKACMKFKKRMIKNTQMNKQFIESSFDELVQLYDKLNITFKIKE